MRLVFGISGASGMPLAQAVLATFATVPGIEIHLLISHAARLAMRAEGGPDLPALTGCASAFYEIDNMAAPPASGSWQHGGMIICPCSMSSLAAIATGAGANLMHRAADVTLKERRPLILAVRETPLSLIHLRNMTEAAEAGAVIMPFMPAFYAGDHSMHAAMRQFAGRMLDMLHIPHALCARWQGDGKA